MHKDPGQTPRKPSKDRPIDPLLPNLVPKSQTTSNQPATHKKTSKKQVSFKASVMSWYVDGASQVKN